MPSVRDRSGPGRSAASASGRSDSGRPVYPTALDAMRGYFPQWTAANLVSPEKRARLKAQESSTDQVESPFADFYLSCNWIFSPDALAEFLEEMRKLSTKADMVYEVDHGCFRVRCLRSEEDELMGSASDILARIVDPELEKMAQDENDANSGVETDVKRYRIREIDEWRSSRKEEGADEAYEIFAYPPSLMAMRYRATWKFPKEDSREAMTVSRLLPNDQNLLDLQESTSCIIVRGLDDVSLQLGSNSDMGINLALAKVKTLLKYYSLVAGPDKTSSHVLNAEGEPHLTELRFLAHINEKLVRNFLLDRTKYRQTNDQLAYRSVFLSGCAVRMMSFNHFQGEYQPAPDPTIVSAIPKNKALEPFEPFKQYEYAPKMSNWLDDNSSNSTTSVACMGELRSVNPQAAPNVAAWAKKLPASGDHSTATNPVLLQEPISWPQIQPSDEAAGSTASEPAIDPNEDLIDLSLTDNFMPSPRIAKSERDDRVFHYTMRQQAPSRKQPQKGHEKEMIGRISNNLVSYVEPLRIFQGEVTLKAQLVRLVLTKMHISQVNISNIPSERRAVAKTGDERERTLDDHTDQAAMISTNVISYHGGDMNYIAGMQKTPPDSSPMWEPKSKRVFYEFRCMTVNPETRKRTHFIVEIDAASFVYRAYVEGKPSRAGSVFVHCMKREFDVQFDVRNASDLAKNCGGFASEIISSLAVRPQNGAPHLTFINHSDWQVDIKSVRVRHTMSYSNSDDTCELEITQVQDLWLSTDAERNKVMYLSARPWKGEPKKGILPRFFEACIKSTVAEKSFEENKGLGFAEEATWTGVGMKPAFRDLARTAMEVVKRMDGVAAHCDNNQQTSIHGVPPRSRNEAKVYAQATTGGVVVDESYW